MTRGSLADAVLPPAAPRDLRLRLQSGIAFNLLGALFNQGSTFAVNVVVANLLGRGIFGEYAMIQSTLAMLAAIGQLSMGYTTTRFVAEFRSADRARTGRILGLCSLISLASAVAVSVGLLAGAPWLARDVLGAPNLAPGLRIAAGAVFFTVVNGFLAGALAGLESYRALAHGGILSGVLYLLIGVGATWTGGLYGALAGLAVSATAQGAILTWLLVRESARQRVGFDYRNAWRERKIVVGFAIPASLIAFVTLPAVWLASAFLARQPGGYQQLALFGAANSFRTAILFLPQTVNSVGLSLLNNQRSSSEEGYRRVFRMNLAITILTVTGGSAFVALAGVWLLRLFGPGFDEGHSTLLILTGVAILEAVAIAIYQVLFSQARIWLSLFAVSLPRDATIVLLAALLAGRYGAPGLAAAHGVGWALALTIITVVAWRLGLTIDAGRPRPCAPDL